MDRSLIGKNIRMIREYKNLSQAEVAEKANISRVTYGKIERGKVDFIASTLMGIAKALDVKVADLLYKGKELEKVRFN